MNAEAFVLLVQRMRAAQNSYYKNGRKMSDLVDAKRFEKQVDQALLHGISFPVEAHLEVTEGPLGEGEQLGMFMENDNETTEN